MAQKNATPRREQKEILRKNGLRPWEWVVLQELRHRLIIRHRINGDVKTINKSGGGTDCDGVGDEGQCAGVD